MIKINILGDFFAKNPASIQFDKTIKEYIQNSNISVCNFEGPIESNNIALPKSGPNICQSGKTISFIKDMGFNVFSIGNNHMMDFGIESLLKTSKALIEDNVVGAGSYEKAYTPLIKEIEGIRIGFIAASHYEFGMSSTTDKEQGVAWINDPKIDQLIAQVRPQVDFLFILPHAGVENIDIPLPLWRNRYRSLINQGADAVIGCHPHVPQGKEMYMGKPIYYSLGNFFFERMNDKDPRHQHSIMVQFSIDDNGVLSSSERILKRHNFSVTSLDAEKSQQYLLPLNNMLSDNTTYSSLVDSTVESLWKNVYQKQINYALRKPKLKYGIKHNLKMLIKSILRKNDNLLLLNCFQCESHRWVIEYALKRNL